MTILGKYELYEQLGRGGFGTVYRATDTTLGREVALKVLHPQLTTDLDFLERFRNEARLVASLDSPNIVTIYDLGESDGRVFIAMKYLAGGSLKDRLEKSGAIPFAETVEIMQQVCDGLSVAHEQGLVHRDIKPGNILFDNKGHAVLGDFGLARVIQLSSTSAASSSGGVGTPAYRAPELWLGKPPASPATDIYSLGCVLSEMLTGKALFDGDTTEEVLTKHLINGPSLPKAFPVGVPAGILAVVEKAVSKDTKERYQTVKEFEKRLSAISNKRVPIQKTEIEQTGSEYREYRVTYQTMKTDNNQLVSSFDKNLQKRKLAKLLLGVAGVIIVAFLIVLIVNKNNGSSVMTDLKISTKTEVSIVPETEYSATSNILPVTNAPTEIIISTPAMASETLPPPNMTVEPTITIEPWDAEMYLENNLKCRLGPDADLYGENGLIGNEQVFIYGKNKQNSWFFIMNNSGKQCWVKKSSITTSPIPVISTIVDDPKITEPI